MLSRRVIRLLLLVALLPLASCKTAPMYQPGRVDVSASSKQDMRRAILDSLAARGWRVTGETDDSVSAKLDVRQHSASIRIAYEAGQFDIVYTGSDNLRYATSRNGKATIHRRYNSWIKNLVKDISVRAARGT